MAWQKLNCYLLADKESIDCVYMYIANIIQLKETFKRQYKLLLYVQRSIQSKYAKYFIYIFKNFTGKQTVLKK